MILSHIDVSLSLSLTLPFSLSKINQHVLGGGLKEKNINKDFLIFYKCTIALNTFIPLPSKLATGKCITLLEKGLGEKGASEPIFFLSATISESFPLDFHIHCLI